MAATEGPGGGRRAGAGPAAGRPKGVPPGRDAGLRSEEWVTDPATGTIGGLIDSLGVAAVVLDADGRVALWSPQAQDLFGWTADEALGRYAGRLVVDPDQADLAVALFERVMRETGGWAGVFPIRHKDGSTLLAEFRSMRLRGVTGGSYALGLVAEASTVRRMETDLALSVRLVTQSPIGLAVFDTDLRYVNVNAALERMNGLSESEHLGRTIEEVMPDLDNDDISAAMRQVLETGRPVVDQHTLGRTPADPDDERAWSVSVYRLEGPGRRVLGLAASVIDITERYRAAAEAAQVRQRLALVADASQRIGTTLDLERTAQELVELCVPALADVAAVDVLDSVLSGPGPAHNGSGGRREPAVFRALAVVGHRADSALRAADPIGEVARYDAERLVTRCTASGSPVLVPEVTADDLGRIARNGEALDQLAEAGVHSYLAVPLIARGEVIGALDLKRAGNPLPFTEDDAALAGELALRAAVSIDNARWYQSQRHAALALQHHLLPGRPPERPGLRIDYRYEPARGPSEVGGDWFDVISLSGDRTALVVGDVMGSGINAAATMGQVRTATRTLAELDLDPAALLGHLDTITTGLDRGIATCVYVVHDPRTRRCRVAVAGHMPPVLTRLGEPPHLLDLPTGAPLGVGGVAFEATEFQVRPGDQLVLYTDGLVESRDQSLDTGLRALVALLDQEDLTLGQTCDRLIDRLRPKEDADDVALLVSRIVPLP